ncbi:MAG: helix-turn-helix domain-containing protein [Treponema sp.]|jgi:transcriptional regulator with XRE-family HTH domain|nr:helix-turn-helix domain-containing protein [Treponema sp.]
MNNRKGVVAEYDYAINERVIEIRKTLGYSQQQFSEIIKLSRSCEAGIEIKRRKVNDRLAKMICLTYGVNEEWLKTGKGEMLDASRDPRLERIIRNFKKMPPLLQDYAMDYIDWLVNYYEGRKK